jgi:signal transduction histidine kinase
MTSISLSKSWNASRTLIHVINDLLDLTRAEKGNQLLFQEPFDLRSTIRDAVSMHRVEAERRGLEFEVIEEPIGTPATVLGDRAKIRQLIANVAANAVKHTRSKLSS